MFSQNCIQSINSDYSNIYRNEEAGTWWHYDNYGYKHNEDEYRNANDSSSVHLVEWPDHQNEKNSRINCLWAFYYEGERNQAKRIQKREIDFYAPKEIEEMSEYEEFLAGARDAGLLLSRE